jgi:hypothetical protein
VWHDKIGTLAKYGSPSAEAGQYEKDVGLAPRHVLDKRRVGQKQGKIAVAQDMPHRFSTLVAGEGFEPPTLRL